MLNDSFVVIPSANDDTIDRINIIICCPLAFSFYIFLIQYRTTATSGWSQGWESKDAVFSSKLVNQGIQSSCEN